MIVTERMLDLAGVQKCYIIENNLHFNRDRLFVICEGKWDTVYNKLKNKTSFEEKANVKLPKPNPIGSGSKGVVYDIGKGKVLKITTDRSEAYASSLIQNKRHRGLWRVYGVYDTDAFTGDYYFIVGEKLKLKPDAAMDIVNIFGGPRGLGNTTFIKWDKSFLNNIIDDEGFEDNKHARDIAWGMYHLYKKGIEFDDFKAPNIMFRGNDAVLIDLGYSQSPKGKIVKV